MGSAKKRKTDGMQKFYAVRAGFVPGVYLTYPECQKQTAGFKGAVFKSFLSRQDAYDFVAGKEVAPSANEPDRFYAVAVGNPTGIYTKWEDASAAITGVKGPKYKRFATRKEAVGYIKQHGNREAIEALGEVAVDIEPPEPKLPETSVPAPSVTKAKTASKKKPAYESEPGEGFIRIYTDGSSLNNGQADAQAGLGVFFGEGDSRNLCERLPGEPQTNQRAELMAVLRALDQVASEQSVEIFTDSRYAIRCVTEWPPGWKAKGWKTATGEDVKNKDIIVVLLEKVDERTKAGGVTTFKWVKGHDKCPGNIAADRLANRGSTL